MSGECQANVRPVGQASTSTLQPAEKNKVTSAWKNTPKKRQKESKTKSQKRRQQQRRPRPKWSLLFRRHPFLFPLENEKRSCPERERRKYEEKMGKTTKEYKEEIEKENEKIKQKRKRKGKGKEKDSVRRWWFVSCSTKWGSQSLAVRESVVSVRRQRLDNSTT